MMDALASGRRIKCLTVVDDFSCECVRASCVWFCVGTVAREPTLLQNRSTHRQHWNALDRPFDNVG